MPTQHSVTGPLRDAVNARLGPGCSVRTIADAAGVDYRRLLTFSQGGLPDFDASDVDRLADYLGLRLMADVVQPEKASARGKAR